MPFDVQEAARSISTSNTAPAPEGFEWTPEGVIPVGWPAACGNFVAALVPGPAPSDAWIGIGDKGGIAKSDTAPMIPSVCSAALHDELERRVLLTIS